MIKMQYCKSCVYPTSTVNLQVDDEGVCSSCRTGKAFQDLNAEFWAQRKERFEKIIAPYTKNNKSNYDCLIPVSGGKDSFYQAHLMCKEYGLKPLLMTYHGNNFLPEADHNRDLMRHVFDADHIVWGPSVDTLKKLNKLTFKIMGDMNWQNHCGITSSPIQIAVKFEIPLIIWGEISWDISGMYAPDDFVEFSARSRHEHDLRGYEWYDMLEYGIKEKDMLWAKYPSDEEILEVGVRGLYIGNFFKWDPIRQTELVMKNYDWIQAEKPFERTYRRISNLDDRYENGIHDLLKFVKFGYGRASDHASKDIKTGDMTREEGIEMVRKYDAVVSSDLFYWLDYVGMTEQEFWEIADSFRDPRVWWIENGKWWKDNIWGEPASYGDVHLTDEQLKDFKKTEKNLSDDKYGQ
ncbi:N-acetyl sugar amidotransferase [uncultured Paraglaciecola sp.]|uniref:N-acetyl sugar amidotransferase n=1 Tax=uncultured Paraglaciecola sp. TaxID=1765024 RepID=UPI0025D7E3ED|nr:N-acetyl sugar amidotransferase [uncultured Paraglaciecola sp.]